VPRHPPRCGPSFSGQMESHDSASIMCPALPPIHPLHTPYTTPIQPSYTFNTAPIHLPYTPYTTPVQPLYKPLYTPYLRRPQPLTQGELVHAGRERGARRGRQRDGG